jgi:hypothetical protein
MILTSRAKIDPHIIFRLVRYIPGSGKAVSVMVWVSKCGLMELDTKENGVKTELTARANLLMLMAMYMMATGLMIRRTELAFTNTLTEPSMRECGKMTSSMAKE